MKAAQTPYLIRVENPSVQCHLSKDIGRAPDANEAEGMHLATQKRIASRVSRFREGSQGARGPGLGEGGGPVIDAATRAARPAAVTPGPRVPSLGPGVM